ncbi:glucosidase 2 subunit beta-like [Pecten maximus]|uniref:glucosidase 2 subunit beta-like n=1 Tax=Pecten maximus TaxID=6579 RepID=UPI00145908C2|nr:glucosidase 2 subunit beta-like [Pecten maximus]
MPRNVLTKRRKQILLLILAAGFIFLTFQIFSLSALNISNRLSALRAMDDDGELGINLVRGNRHRRNQAIEEFDMHVEIDVNQRKTAKSDNSDSLKFKPEDSNHRPPDGSEIGEQTAADLVNLPRGVHRTDARYYKPITGNLFLCLDKKKNIPFSQVNDDFCDCDDGSDEPGTSACLDGRFFCTHQIPDERPQSITSSRVNDGLCDCCDGTDEWKEITAPPGVQRAARNTATVLTVPCQNLCNKVIQRKEEDTKIREIGKRHRQEYVKAASHLHGEEKEKYGPDGVFFKLSRSCFPFKSSGYEYTVCPFKSVKQQQFPRASKLLGETAVWEYMSEGLYILNMLNGASHLCPGEVPRKSVISFLCGINDRVVSILEQETCVYAVKFSTPAAC